MAKRTMRKSELEKRVAYLESVLKAYKDRHINVRERFQEKEFIALPLELEELRAIKEKLHEHILKVGIHEGEKIDGTGYDTSEGLWEASFTNWHLEETFLPQWDGYTIQYSYHEEFGSEIQTVWGLKEVKK